MDKWEASEMVFQRLRALDPEKELIRLAFGPDHLLHSFVARVRAELAAKPVLGLVQAGPLWRMPPTSGGGGHAPLFPGEHQMGSDAGGGEVYPDDYNCWSPASGGLLDADFAAWRPCLYYARVLQERLLLPDPARLA